MAGLPLFIHSSLMANLIRSLITLDVRLRALAMRKVAVWGRGSTVDVVMADLLG